MLQPIVTIQLFFLQILHGNTACEHLRHLAQMTFTGAAYCTARMRIPLSVFQTLLARTAARMKEEVSDTGRWLGHRLFYVDGSSFSSAGTSVVYRKNSGQPGGQEGRVWIATALVPPNRPDIPATRFRRLRFLARRKRWQKPPHSKIARGPRQLAALCAVMLCSDSSLAVMGLQPAGFGLSAAPDPLPALGSNRRQSRIVTAGTSALGGTGSKLPVAPRRGGTRVSIESFSRASQTRRITWQNEWPACGLRPQTISSPAGAA